MEGAPELFERGSSAKEPVVDEAKIQALHTNTGELTVANGTGTRAFSEQVETLAR